MSKRSGKVRRTERYRYLVADPGDATRELAEARLAEVRARSTAQHDEAFEQLQRAQKGLEACYDSIVLRALAPHVHQKFVQEWAERDEAHAAAVKAAEEAEQDPPALPDPTWDADSLEVRFLAACDLDNEHTAAWWAAEFAGDEWTLTERDELLGLCYTINLPRRSFDLGVLGKG